MSVRIRYTVSSSSDSLESKQTFLTRDGRTVKVVLLASQEYLVIDSTSRESVSSQGGFTSLSSVKKAAKQALVDLGVVFGQETRQRVASGSDQAALRNL